MFVVPELPSTKVKAEFIFTAGLGSLSAIVITVVEPLPIVVPALAFESAKLNVSLVPSYTLSLIIPIVTVLVNSPGAKVKVPLVAV